MAQFFHRADMETKSKGRRMRREWKARKRGGHTREEKVSQRGSLLSLPLSLFLFLSLSPHLSPSLRLCLSPSLTHTHTHTHTQRDMPKQPHNWDKRHLDTENNTLRDTDIKIHWEKLQLELLLPFKDWVRRTIIFLKNVNASCIFVNVSTINDIISWYSLHVLAELELRTPCPFHTGLGEAMAQGLDYMWHFIAYIFQCLSYNYSL